jgi:holo-[acyl-carrier protein] synthase
MSVVGVGVDVVDVSRLAEALQRTPTLAGRLFHERERASVLDEVQRLAGRFAVKEAVAKALALPGARFLEVEVVRNDDGRPGVVVSGETAERAAALGVARFHVSIAHDAGVATAFVVAET